MTDPHNERQANAAIRKTVTDAKVYTVIADLPRPALAALLTDLGRLVRLYQTTADLRRSLTMAYEAGELDGIDIVFAYEEMSSCVHLRQ